MPSHLVCLFLVFGIQGKIKSVKWSIFNFTIPVAIPAKTVKEVIDTRKVLVTKCTTNIKYCSTIQDHFGMTGKQSWFYFLYHASTTICICFVLWIEHDSLYSFSSKLCRKKKLLQQRLSILGVFSEELVSSARAAEFRPTAWYRVGESSRASKVKVAKTKTNLHETGFGCRWH